MAITAAPEDITATLHTNGHICVKERNEALVWEVKMGSETLLGQVSGNPQLKLRTRL
jgi:hypothetical protein